ncbi:integrase core domain-containing protein [Burkholderia thailandensis]|uniref:integrase core domain-containing protein n=1 Tax=Burkholderia thailandensis TaxID=57975 RepID=UPI0039BF4FFC
MARLRGELGGFTGVAPVVSSALRLSTATAPRRHPQRALRVCTRPTGSLRRTKRHRYPAVRVPHTLLNENRSSIGSIPKRRRLASDLDRRSQAYESVSHARRSIGDYIELYNRKRPHSSLADQTPDEAYFATLPAIKSAA